MNLIVVFTDDWAAPELERALLEEHRGFTVLPTLVGSGKTGLHAGDRVHPGASAVVVTVVADEEKESAIAAITAARDRAGAGDSTRIFVTRVEEIS